MTTKAQNGVAGAESDLGTLWRNAVEDYCKQTGRKDLLRDMPARNMKEVMSATEESMQTFQGFRHKGDKVDKVRSAFGRNLEGIQKCMTGIEVVGAVAGAFPPAMPVAIVFSACGHLLSAFASVKADYDKVEEFFSYSSRFYERLTILEGMVSDNAALARAIVRVFSAQLSVCAIVEVWTKTKAARFKQFLSALWNMQDPALASSFGTMQASVDELGATVGYASYAEIKSTKAVTLTVSAKADEIDANIKGFRDKVGKDLQLIYESQLGMREQMADGFHTIHRTQTLLLDRFEQDAARKEALEAERAAREARFQETMLKALQEKGKADHAESKRKQNTKNLGKGDPADKKIKALNAIKDFFMKHDDTFLQWKDAYKENSSQEKEMTDVYVEHTAEWITTEPAFQQWTEGNNPLLWMKGPDGIGKSFLAHVSLQKLRARDNGNNSFAYFYFKEDSPYLQSAQNAIACVALQVAEANSRYAEQIAAKLKEEGENAPSTSTWEKIFLSIFGEAPNGTDSDDHFYLIFDGLDESPKEQQEVFLEFLQKLLGAKSRLHVLITSRPSVGALQKVEPLTLDVTKEKMLDDMRTIVGNRINKSDRLKKFSPKGKAIIRRTVSQHADGILYVEHMMQRLKYIGRESAVLKDLKNPPNDLSSLYKLMLDECRRNRTKEQYEGLKKLFAWLAFSRRSLTLAEASEIARLTITEKDFDIEDEIFGRSERILGLSREEHKDEENRNEIKDDDTEDHGEDAMDDIEEKRKASLKFQERSLRQYFRAVTLEALDEDELRTPASAAHLSILTMCIDTLISSANANKNAKADSDAELPELKSYAVDYWYEHLKELDVSSASDDEVRQVLVAVHRILNNESNVARLFESYARHTELYPDRDSETATPWYDSLKSWAARASTISEEKLGQEVAVWSREIVANPGNAFLQLAKAHVENWKEESDRWRILIAYEFAASALRVVGMHTPNQEEKLKEILSVASSFGNRDQDAKTLRSAGICLFFSQYGLDSEEKKKEYRATSIEYLERSLQMSDIIDEGRASTLLVLGDFFSYEEKYEKALEALDRSLDCFPASESSNSGDEHAKHEIMVEIQTERGCMLWKLQKRDAALDALNKARSLAKDTKFWILDHITTIIDEIDTASDGHKLMEALKSWSEKERFDWFGGNISYGDVAAFCRMYRAAKAADETPLVLQWLNDFEKTLLPTSSSRLGLGLVTAVFHEKVLDDKEKAKETLRQTLTIQSKNDENDKNELELIISQVRATLASIIFTQFRDTSDPQRKDDLLKEMKNLPGMTTDDEFRESHIGMLVVHMLRIMGPAREYQNALDRIFTTCINGLEDSVSWNDSDSLRLLAKVLSSVDGLEHDALIALSAQFSSLDQKPEFNEDSNETKAVDDADKEESSTKAPEEEHTATDEKSTEVNSVQEETNANKETTASPESDGDLADFWCGCDGTCNKYTKSWTEPYYLCLICTNTDLCAKCHSKRLDWNSQGGESKWTTFCGKNHHYIRGPVAGWKGIKSGVIRIGEDEIPVKRWIRELKEERWPKAWERFWVRESGLKDIQ